jgi:hypothetical protein
MNQYATRTIWKSPANSCESKLGLIHQNDARSIDMEFLIVTLLGLLLMSLPIYGLLRLGIYIGAQRALDNIAFGFMSAGRDHSELPGEMKALQSAIANRNCWYGLFGVSKADWYKNKMTADIGDRLEFLGFETGRLFQRHMEEM